MNLYVELRHLRYVIAVADELHFTRAANQLHLAPPSLSKQIKQLEAVLGYALFERKTREVLLTPAGAAFVAEARQSLVHAERAVECGGAVSRGEAGALSVGYTPWLDPSILATVRTAFTSEAPKTQLTFHSAYTVTQVDLLLKGTLQAGIIVLPVPADGLLIQRIWRDMLSVAVPEDHRLAEQDRIALKDVQEEPVIWMARSINPAFYDHLLKRCHQLGFVPNIVHEVMTVTEALNLVASRVGVTFVKTSTGAHLQEKGVVFRELAEPGLAVETAIAYRDDNRSLAVHVLVRLLRERSNCDDP